MTISGKSLQEKYAPSSTCFGCGPSNPRGLKIGTYPDPTNAEETIAEFKPESYQEAFPGMVNGGIIGALLDCHSNWTAAYHLMQKLGLDHPPCTVTADFHVVLKRPTPSNVTLTLRARVKESKEDRAQIEATLEADGKVCATCSGTFVQVKEGHPAYHRW